MKNIAVIGAGYWGKNLVRTFFNLGVLNTICDTSPRLLKEYENAYPGIKLTARIEDLLADTQIEGVVIAAPAVIHYPLASQCLKAGKNVFVEKPLALKAEEGEELVRLAKEKQKTLMVGHILQYHDAVIKMHEMIKQGELGKIRYIYSNRLNIGKIRSEENILWSFAPHDISVILMLLQEFPSEIYTTGGAYLQHNIADVTLTTMNFPSGVRAHIFVSWLHPFKEQKLVIVGDKKMLVFDDMSKEKLFLYPHEVKWIDRQPVAAKADPEIVPVTMTEPLKNECEHFLECINSGKKPKTDAEEGLRVLKILQASQESLNQSGKTISFKSEKKVVPEGKIKIHESAYVDAGVEIGEGTQIWHFSHVLKGSKIGQKCKIGQNVVIGPDAVIGNNCKIQNNVSVYKGVILEDDVFCGPSMVFTNVNNPRSAIIRMDEIKLTPVGKGASIGANATIVCVHKIGRHAFVGAGSVVTKDVPDYALVMGNPARQKGWICECGVKLELKKGKSECGKCGKNYKEVKGMLRREK